MSKPSTLEISFQLRIYTLFRKIIDVIENELLHNLETYYFLVGIHNISVMKHDRKYNLVNRQ